MLIRIWKVTGSIQLQSLDVRSIFVFKSTPSGNKLVVLHNRMGMKFASMFNGALVVQPQRKKKKKKWVQRGKPGRGHKG
eukprot:1161139-Pelagomonas_calceolata.AAC.7